MIIWNKSTFLLHHMSQHGGVFPISATVLTLCWFLTKFRWIIAKFDVRFMIIPIRGWPSHQRSKLVLGCLTKYYPDVLFILTCSHADSKQATLPSSRRLVFQPPCVFISTSWWAERDFTWPPCSCSDRFRNGGTVIMPETIIVWVRYNQLSSVTMHYVNVDDR